VVESGIKTLHGGISQGGIGVNLGTVNQYAVAPEAPPAERVLMARRCLHAGLRDQATTLLEQAVAQGYNTMDTHYYRLLAAVSRRSPEELTNEEWWQLGRLLHVTPHADTPPPGPDPGGYTTAAWVVARLLFTAVEPPTTPTGGSTEGSAGTTATVPPQTGPTGPGGATGGVGAPAPPEGLAVLAGLPPERGEEVRDHLRQLIERVRRDARAGEDEVRLAQRRLGNERARRVPYFFTADPLPPPAPDPPMMAWPYAWPLAALIAAGAFVGALILLLTTFTEATQSPDESGVFMALSVQLLVAAALLLLLGQLPRARQVAYERRRRSGGIPVAAPARRGRRAGAVPPSPEAVRAEAVRADPVGRQRAQFRETVESLIHARFEEHTPAPSPYAGDWQTGSNQLRMELAEELTYRYWQSGSPAGLDWLIQRRAAEEAERWPGRRRSPREPRPRLPRTGAVLGVVLIALLYAQAQAGSAEAESTLGIILSLWTVTLIAGWLALRWLADADLTTEQQRRHAADRPAHAAWQDQLWRARPTDLQMAEWLDLDQRHLLREMRREHRMEDRDIIFSFFVTEAAHDCVRARVGGGPARYSAYLQKLFVLTGRGVWMSTWQVDFASGRHTGRNDVVFRYDSINSAMLETVGRGGVTAGDNMGAGLRHGGTTDGVPSEALRLVLANRQYLDVFLEDYALLDTTEQTGDLRELARESSGVSLGFRVLAALATEGKEWVEQRREYARRALLREATEGVS
jgi:hypothetical protein